jgi:hypothetical protein
MNLTRLPILLVSLWALAALEGVQSAPASTCAEQSMCIDFSVELAEKKKCDLDCPVRVCLIFNLAAPNCVRRGGDPSQLEYACDNARKNQCVRPDTWNKVGPHANSVDSPNQEPNRCKSAESSDEVCEPLETGDKMCQVASPGKTLYWTL